MACCSLFWVMEIGLVLLLRAAWLAGTLLIVIAYIPSSRLSWFRECLLGFSRRGKIMQSTSKSFTVPQKFFCHFYVLAVMWTTFLLVSTWFYAYNVASLVYGPFQFSTIATHLTGASSVFSWHGSRSSTAKHRYGVWQSVLLLLMMEVQVLRRLFESICVFNYSPSARMHIFGYLTGLFFYTAAPLSLCGTFAPEAFQFAVTQVTDFIVKGKNQIPTIEFDWWGFVSPLTTLRWHTWIGMAIFFYGWIRQRRCHAILCSVFWVAQAAALYVAPHRIVQDSEGSLRENAEQADEYVIPRGDWFEYVSSPHFLAEIVIYAGLVVASGGTDLTIWLLFGFVVANLAFAAAETNRWYLRKFDDYPRNRFAIIPFVY